MFSALYTFIQHYIDVTDEQLQFIASRFDLQKAKKNRILLSAEEVSEEFILITKGCTRVYLKDSRGKEVAVWFALPGYIGSDIQSFISGRPSQFFIQALTDIEYVRISKEAFQRISETVPQWETFQAKIWGEAVVHIIDRIIQFQYQSAEERYELLLKNPMYSQWVPQKHLASFLGITHTSLSRLRKKRAKRAKKLP